MRGGRIFVVGPPDTVLGLGLLGIEGAVATDAREAALAFERALAAPGVAMVLVSRAWSDALRERFERAALDAEGPLVIEIPEPDGGEAETPLAERIERVLDMPLTR